MSGTTSKRVLIVDDEPRIRRWLSTAFQAAGYEVTTADDGIEALERIAVERPDLLLLDVMMPRMDGFEVVTRLKAAPSIEGMRVVMLTGMPADASRRAAINRAEEIYQAPKTGSLGYELVVIKGLLKDPAELIRALESICPPR